MEMKKIGSLKLKRTSELLALAIIFLFPANTYAAAKKGSCVDTTTGEKLKDCVQNNQIVQDLQAIINALSTGVVIIVVGMIILGGIQYMMAGDSPEAIAKAKQRIINALIALFSFLLVFAFLQWLIPGGIFG